MTTPSDFFVLQSLVVSFKGSLFAFQERGLLYIITRLSLYTVYWITYPDSLVPRGHLVMFKRAITAGYYRRPHWNENETASIN